MQFTRHVFLLWGCFILCTGTACSNNSDTPSLTPTASSVPQQSPTPSSSATATQEAVAVPAEPTPENLIFDLSTANKTLPDDLIREVTFFSTGGWPDDSMCNRPSIFVYPEDNELMTLVGFVVCGVSGPESLTGKVLYPDGKVLTLDIQAEPMGASYWGSLAFKPKIDDPEGVYTFSIAGKDFTLEAQATYTLPDGPRLYKLDNEHILLYGFQPKEKVRLAFYKADFNWVFVGWEEYVVGEDGRAVIYVSVGQAENEFELNKLFIPRWIYTFVAFGEQTGEVRLLHNNGFGGAWSLITGQTQKQPNVCEGLPSRLFETARARVASLGGDRLRVRTSAGFSQEIKTHFAEGTQLTIKTGPTCADGSTWWYVQAENGQTGWVAEYRNDTYFLEPIP